MRARARACVCARNMCNIHVIFNVILILFLMCDSYPMYDSYFISYDNFKQEKTLKKKNVL